MNNGARAWAVTDERYSGGAMPKGWIVPASHQFTTGGERPEIK